MPRWCLGEHAPHSGRLRQARTAKPGRLVLGIGMAFAITTVAAPTALAVAVVVGLGVLIGGLPRLGTASEWIPMAALFVLVLGDSNAEGFSFAYVLQMALGVTVGFAVNWLIFPPLHLDDIDPAIAGHQGALSRQLKDMARAWRSPGARP